MNKDLEALLIAIPLVMAVVGVNAFASERGGDRIVPQGRDASLISAISLAERETGGKAVEAERGDDGRDFRRIIVAINGPKGAQTVHVDTTTGTISNISPGEDQD